MALIRWQPFHEMEALQRDMNRMFETLASNEQGSMRQSFMPLAEMEQTEDAVHIKVEVPGMKADDIDVQVTQEAVMISGERKSQFKSNKNGMARSEFRYGKFNRTIPLPVPIDNSQVKGDYQDGVLTLELPKLQKKENKVTKVKIGSGNTPAISPQPDTPVEKVAADNLNQDGGYGNQDAWGEENSTSSTNTH